MLPGVVRLGYATLPAEQLTGEEWIAADPLELAGIIERFTAAA